jgi:hypothetical protein
MELYADFSLVAQRCIIRTFDWCRRQLRTGIPSVAIGVSNDVATYNLIDIARGRFTTGLAGLQTFDVTIWIGTGDRSLGGTSFAFFITTTMGAAFIDVTTCTRIADTRIISAVIPTGRGFFLTAPASTRLCFVGIVRALVTTIRGSIGIGITVARPATTDSRFNFVFVVRTFI